MNESNINHRIYARHSGVPHCDRLSIPLIKWCIRKTLNMEGVDSACEVSVLITDDRGICEINNKYRGIDKPTDVLSFPLQEFSVAGWAVHGFKSVDPETGNVPLGDIIMSAQRVVNQAREHMQTRERETAYLTVHSVLHLLGYDHIDEAEDKNLMREREKEIIQELDNN